MNTKHSIILLMGVFFVVLGALVTFLFRRALLSLRYWVGWMVTAACMTLGSVLTLAFGTERDWYWAIPLVVAAPVMLLISVQLSVSISGHRRLIIRLAQEVADLTNRLDRMADDRPVALTGLSNEPDHRSQEHVDQS